MGWPLYRKWMALAHLDGWDEQPEAIRIALAHVKATLHNELLPLIARAGFEVGRRDVRTASDYLGDNQTEGAMTDQELDAAIRHVSMLG